MKIISKYKDYYDYLVGIYGEDPLLVYVRSGEPLVCNQTFFKSYLNPYKYPRSITDRVGYFKDMYGHFDHGIKLGTFDENKTGMRYFHYRWNFLYNQKPLHEHIHGSLRTFYLVIGYYSYRFEMDRYMKLDGSIVDDILFEKTRIETKDRRSPAPIYISMSYETRREINLPEGTIIDNPILKDTFISSYIPAEDIWDHVCEFIGLSKDIEPRPLSDKEKIEQHGFDKVTSFRNM